MRLGALRWIQRLFLLIIIAAVAAGGWNLWQQGRAVGSPAQLLPFFAPSSVLRGQHIGIVAGHSGNDPGATCPDGLTEAQVNLSVAEAVTRELRRRGATVDLLEEFDARLAGYRADAFVSIHADSCEVNLSGFKVASLEGGSSESELLTACLWERYEEATALPRHLNTITYDMRRYHAFREIAPETPAAIIETGFLGSDRAILVEQTGRVMTGIVASIECFLTGTPETPEGP